MLKKCNACGEEKQLNEFRRDSSRKDGRQHSCKICARQFHRSKYHETYYERYSAERKQRRLAAKAVIDGARSCGCALCDEDDLSCLEFHHIDPAEKEFQVGGHGINYSPSRVLAEIAKCVVVCSNCHKKIHAGKISLLP